MKGGIGKKNNVLDQYVIIILNSFLLLSGLEGREFSRESISISSLNFILGLLL